MGDDVRAAHEAMARFAWSEALEHFSRAEKQLTADELSEYGDAAEWARNVDLAIELRGRAFAAHQAADNSRAAARLAIQLSYTHQYRGDAALSAAWTRRAEQILAQIPECAEHGSLHWSHSMRASQRGDHATALEHAERAIDLATRHRDKNGLALASLRRGRVLMKVGRSKEVMAIVDDIMIPAVAGELDAITTGIVCCSAIDLCNDLFELDRSSEWTDVTERWCERTSVAGFPGICRVHRAEILRLRGKWHDAEREVLRAADEVRGARANAVLPDAFRELGEIRMRMGNLAGAAEAFRQAHELGREPMPGLALLWLEEGRGQAAASKIAQALAEAAPGDRLGRAKFLPAQVLIAIRTGDLETARKAADELDAIAADMPALALQAHATTSRGLLHLASRDTANAIQVLRRAIQLWTQLDAPYEAAQARVSLAEAYRATGDREASDLEMRSARSAFERLGAAHSLAQTKAPEQPVSLSETLAASAPPLSAATAATVVGQIVDGKLELTKFLGGGGMGLVFEAKNRNTGRRVAVKLLRRDACSDPAACQRMVQEALACGRIEHPNVVDIYDAGQCGTQPYIVMELLRGESLATRIERLGKLPIADVIDIALQALAGIAAAHGAGIVHRDLKPDNLFLVEAPTGVRVKVVDFGISKLADNPSTLADTKTGTIVGTPYYMSPEQATGSKQIDERTDIYAMGAVMFHAIAGRPPFVADNYNALIAAILTTTPASVKSLRPETPEGLDTVITQALAREPGGRPRSATALTEALRGIALG